MMLGLIPFIFYSLVASASNKVKKTRVIRRFAVTTVGPFPLECLPGTILKSKEATSHCMSDYDQGRITATAIDSDTYVEKAWLEYCPEFIKKGETCNILLNEKEATRGRFSSVKGINCEDNVFVGVYWCEDKNSSEAATGEVVTIMDEEKEELDLKCPEGHVILIINAQKFGSALCNRGYRHSIIQEAQEKCNGKQKCKIKKTSYAMSDCHGLPVYHAATYICNPPSAKA
ncbi:D-galactoside-L-rhamnose binding SUEL lectin domain superfamily [Babesia duncani]|uniref:D-galactoside-L-rhamnose binding SUEL lectin domain superfamily n=1 Tax=Babesia duncani TaxID=323732 RepID=A0AAD9PLW4_9APIC|nr:D-galactoside-L-rhamnose binding SUEL lectin domain superfamily [Babesia duncani]